MELVENYKLIQFSIVSNPTDKNVIFKWPKITKYQWMNNSWKTKKKKKF